MADQFQETEATLREDTYKVGSVALEDGFYVCVPCGNKKYFKAGMRFPSCLMCLGKKRKLFRRGLELWEKFSNSRKSNQPTKVENNNK